MIHLVCGSQGEVGKTLISVVLTQYLRDHGKRVRAYDLDPFYGTFAAFETLEVERPALWKGSDFDLNAKTFDAFMEDLLLSRDEVVVDVSSRAFLSWVRYLDGNDWYPLFEAAGQSVWVHTAVVCGLRLRETLWDVDFTRRNYSQHVPWWCGSMRFLALSCLVIEDSSPLRSIKPISTALRG